MDYKRVFEDLLNIKLLSSASKQNVKCPFHEDKTPSMSLDFNNGLWYCHACKEGGNVFQLAKKLDKTVDEFGNVSNTSQSNNSQTKKEKPIQKPKKEYVPYSIDDYATEKRLSVEFLKETFNISTSDNNTSITMPYKDIEGKFLYNKYRAYNKKMWSDKNIKLQPYGLWLLPKADKKTIWLVEGESDTQTLWYNDIPSLGLPGASAPSPDHFDYIQEFDEIIVVCESDKGGETFITNIYKILQDYYPEKLADTYIVFPADVGKNDINDIWQIKQDKKFFLKKLEILQSIRLQIIVAYQQMQEKKKWFDPAIRTMAIGLLPKMRVAYHNGLMFEWDSDKQQYKRIDDENNYYRLFLTAKGINSQTRMQALRMQLESFAKSKPPLMEPSEKYVHCKNCSVNYTDITIKHFDEHYFITNRIPFNYNPSAKSFIIDKLFNDWVENPILLYEIVGYTLIKHYPNNKWFILFGRGGNGKTTFLRILELLLNGLNKENDNVAHVGLKELLEDRFASARLYSKHLNSAGEIGYEKINNTKSLKDLTGEDSIEAQFKFRNSFKFTNYAKLIFATNKVPGTTDTTPGFFRRIIIVKFKDIDKNKKDPSLLNKLKKEDYEYLLYKSILALQKLYERGFEFSIDENIEKTYMDLSNPVKLYIDTYCETTKNDKDYVLSTEFVDDFLKWLRKTSQPIMKIRDIYQEMNDLGYEKVKVTTVNGSRRSAFIGIKYKNESTSMPEVDEIPF